MENTPKISVIMPSLNVGNYIRECMESVLHQTLSDIEIICVDAGSTDGTLEILHEYEKTDSRIRVLLSEKKSYGYQMNLGLQASHGEFIGIVETDDWAEPDMFEKLYQAAVEHQADVVKTNYYWYYTNPYIHDKPFENLRETQYDKVFSPKDVVRSFSTAPAIWSGIYRRSLLEKNHITFHETPGASYQDTSFHFMVFTVAERVYFFNQYFLHYRKDNENSSVNTKGKVYCVSDEMHYYEEYLESRPQDKKDLSKIYMALKYEKYRWNYQRIAPEFQWDFLKLVHAEFKTHRNDGLMDRDCFEPEAWEDVNSIIDDPVGFFKRTCKQYSTRPQGQSLIAPEVLHDSNSMSPDVSVVIPVFNDEKNIDRSLSSVRNQTHKNIEIICVDDGSTDQTLPVIMEHARQDGRIKVIHQVNMGIASARNAGLDAASGKYIQFLDSDDYLRVDAVESLLGLAEEFKLEAVYFDGNSFFENQAVQDEYPYYLHAYEYSLAHSVPASGKEYFLQAKEDNKYRVSVCMCLLDREFLVNNKIRFIDGILHEDNPFTFACLMRAKRVMHTPQQYYFRFVRSKSIMTMEKTPVHVYGYLTSIAVMLETVHALPYDQKLLTAVESEIEHLAHLAYLAYKTLSDKPACKKQLNPIEMGLLDRIAAKYRKKAQPQKGNKARTPSRLFQAGRLLLWPASMASKLVALLKGNGFKKTVDILPGQQAACEDRAPQPLFVSSDAYKGSGAFLSEVALNQMLARQHIKSHVILPYTGSGAAIIKSSGVGHHVIPSHDWIVPLGTRKNMAFRAAKYMEHTDNLAAAAQIAQFALQNGYNLIHSNSTYTYVGALAAKITGLPHIWHLREFLEEDQNKEIYCKKKGYDLIRRADCVVTISRALHQKYSGLVAPDKLRLIYNGLDVSKYYNPTKTILENETPVFLFLSGSDSPNKGRADLIKACQRLANNGKKFELWFVGWCGGELQDLVEEAGLSDRTKFFGYQQKTAAYFQQADVFFMCSKFEAFGRTTVEAMLNGCLVIGAATAGTAELLDDGKTGLLYAYGDAADLENKINFALSNRETMRTIAAAGRKYMARHMSAEENASNIVSVYQDILANHPPLSQWRRMTAKCKIGFLRGRCMIRKTLISPILAALAKISNVGNNDGPAKHHETGNPESKNSTGSGPKVSVIIPIYNVKPYLEQCLASVCNQSLQELEIICVNDGSTDGSEQIIQKYAKKDKRIVLVDKPNSGYGASVNRGIRMATGDYIAIVEPDDFIAGDMYEKMYHLAMERGEVDIVKSGYWLYYDEQGDMPSFSSPAPIMAACHPPKDVFQLRDYPEIIYHHPSIWSCLYKRTFIEKQGIRFVEASGAGWVDNPFLIETFVKAKSIAWIPEAFYYYRQTNPNASSFIKDCRIPFQRTQEMLDVLEKQNVHNYMILASVYKRILYNAAEALKNPFYSPQKDDSLIIQQIRVIHPMFLHETRLRTRELLAYEHFMGKVGHP